MLDGFKSKKGFCLIGLPLKTRTWIIFAFNWNLVFDKLILNSKGLLTPMTGLIDGQGVIVTDLQICNLLLHLIFWGLIFFGDMTFLG